MSLWELEYDNRDYRANPSSGSYQRINYGRDFGWLDETEKWSMIRGEASKYVSLGRTSWARQQVLALNAATATTPSWGPGR